VSEVPDEPGRSSSGRGHVPARFLFRFVDPTADAAAAEATVDQIDPSRAVNPIAGFLLPDHIDKTLEVFDASGAPLGQLMHEPIGVV
jgi:hypothetical protein